MIARILLVVLCVGVLGLASCAELKKQTLTSEPEYYGYHYHGNKLFIPREVIR